jgi:hypothetical protein
MAQSDWRWCKKCQGLFFAANKTLGVCPAGDAHTDAGSDNYVLGTSGSGQSDWNWCSKCQGLFFAGNKTARVCPAGGGHNGATSSDYVLPSSGSGQPNWRWCSKCQGLFFAGNKTAGVCPAGGGHNGATSSDYVLASASSRPNIDYTVVLMLWGPPQPPDQTEWPSTLTGPDLSDALIKIAAGGYFSALTQYQVKKVTISGTPTALTTPPWPAGDKTFTTRFTMNDVVGVIEKSFSLGVSAPDKFTDSTPVYIVITPRGGLMTDDPSSLGVHSTFSWGPHNKNVVYAYVGAQADLNSTLSVATHEIVEAMGANGDAPMELCDNCQDLYGAVNAGIGSFTVAPYFDASMKQCVAPPSFNKPAS